MTNLAGTLFSPSNSLKTCNKIKKQMVKLLTYSFCAFVFSPSHYYWHRSQSFFKYSYDRPLFTNPKCVYKIPSVLSEQLCGDDSRSRIRHLKHQRTIFFFFFQIKILNFFFFTTKSTRNFEYYCNISYNTNIFLTNVTLHPNSGCSIKTIFFALCHCGSRELDARY